jgi:GTPase
VGFIRKLPHHLIESFKSTLDEVREADVLIHVVDVAHPAFHDHIQVVNETLQEIGAGDKPTLLVFNKCDILQFGEDQSEESFFESLKEYYAGPGEITPVFISAISGQGMDEFKEHLLAAVKKRFFPDLSQLPKRSGLLRHRRKRRRRKRIRPGTLNLE